MSIKIYSEILGNLKDSIEVFLDQRNDLSEEIDEDMLSILECFDIESCRMNINGNMKSIDDLLGEISQANKAEDRQKCIENISMIRAAIMDIESSFSNAADSLESVIVSIRDFKPAEPAPN
jgi:hypothetical protein